MAVVLDAEEVNYIMASGKAYDTEVAGWPLRDDADN
jgi:hypothetical protein